MSVEKTLYGDGLIHEVGQTSPTPKCKVNGTELYDGV